MTTPHANEALPMLATTTHAAGGPSPGRLAQQGSDTRAELGDHGQRPPLTLRACKLWRALAARCGREEVLNLRAPRRVADEGDAMLGVRRPRRRQEFPADRGVEPTVLVPMAAVRVLAVSGSGVGL